MGVWAVPWEERVMREANTFWFYALCFSLAGAVYSLLFSGSTEASKGKNGKKRNARKSEKEKAMPQVTSSALLTQILVDGCDLLIPAELLDWMPTGDLVIGSTMVLSTLLTANNIWAKV